MARLCSLSLGANHSHLPATRLMVAEGGGLAEVALTLRDQGGASSPAPSSPGDAPAPRALPIVCAQDHLLHQACSCVAQMTSMHCRSLPPLEDIAADGPPALRVVPTPWQREFAGLTEPAHPQHLQVLSTVGAALQAAAASVARAGRRRPLRPLQC